MTAHLIADVEILVRFGLVEPTVHPRGVKLAAREALTPASLISTGTPHRPNSHILYRPTMASLCTDQRQYLDALIAEHGEGKLQEYINEVCAHRCLFGAFEDCADLLVEIHTDHPPPAQDVACQCAHLD